MEAGGDEEMEGCDVKDEVKSKDIVKIQENH